jgi:hypothetical protein
MVEKRPESEKATDAQGEASVAQRAAGETERFLRHVTGVILLG